jgi:tripartite-type tricarboxylate transporter receptor subunit TctC
VIGNRMSEQFGQPVVVDNRVGAGGVIGANIVARAPADGYTILFTTPSTHVIALFMTKDLPYDPVKDFTPITVTTESFQSLAVSASGPFTSLQELVQYAKANPGKVAFGSAGNGTQFHLTGAAFQAATGTELLHIPYKGAPQALTDLVAGQIQMNFSTVSAHLPLYRAGKLRIIGIVNEQRFQGLPSVPAITEVFPAFERPADWMGFFGPAGLPAPVLQRLNGAVRTALDHPEVKKHMEETGLRNVSGSPEDFAALIRAGTASTGKMAKALGLKPE